MFARMLEGRVEADDGAGTNCRFETDRVALACAVAVRAAATPHPARLSATRPIRAADSGVGVAQAPRW